MQDLYQGTKNVYLFLEKKKDSLLEKVFNPDDFFEEIKVKDVAEQFPQLKIFDYTHVSLNEKLVELNHEIISSEYKDRKFANIESYYEMTVDRIV